MEHKLLLTQTGKYLIGISSGWSGRLVIFLFFMHCQYVSATNSIIEDIARSGRAYCQPTLKFYCKNIHVGCAGQSRLHTYTIEITFTDQSALINTTPDEHDKSTTVIAEKVIWAPKFNYVLLWINQDADYIKIHADGKFNHRHYADSNALMAYGACTAQL